MEHSHLQALLEHYGYLVVFFGALLEGETVLIMAGFAAHRGLLELPWVLGLAAAAGFLGDQLFFMLGRYRGQQMVARLPSVQRHAARMEELIQRHRTWLVVGVRFMYGLRIAGPVLIGMSRVSHAKFIVLNLIGAVVWASVVAGLGYVFGQAVELLLQDARRYELALLVSIAAAGAVVWAIRRLRRNHSTGART
jgi:membrane protein DedA with SNARE-associated domain